MATPSTPQPTFPSLTPNPPRADSNPLIAWTIAGIVVLVLLAGILLVTRHTPPRDPHAPQPLAPYAANLVFSNLKLSESTSLSGGKSTFVDGHVHNTGSRTLTAATVQVLFPADQAAPQLETVPLTLIRTHDPYIDTQPLLAAPLAPGDDREFRLIFEDIRPDWNQQNPTIQVVQATIR